MLDFAQARRTMVDCQIRTFDVTDRAILAAFDEVPREKFVPAGAETLAYSDLSIAVPGQAGHVLLAPMVLARMIQALDIESGTTVLDIGSAGGYSTAILASLGARVVSLESSDDAASAVAGRLAEAGLSGETETRSGPLERGAPGDGPFDAILLNGAVEEAPAGLLRQLADGGRLVCLRGDGRTTRAVLFVRSGDAFGSRILFDAAAPLLPAFRKAAEFNF